MTRLTISRDKTLAELRQLRRGRGVLDRNLDQRMGPHLRRLAGAEPYDDLAALRSKLSGCLRVYIGKLPGDLQLAGLAALALHADAQHRFVQERIDWLAGRIGRDQRTARRRVDEALERLAELMSASDPDGPGASADAERWNGDDWHVRAYRALLRLDTPTPELMDERTVVFTRDGLSSIEASLGLPRRFDDTETAHGLGAEMLYGARITKSEQPSETFFRYELALPRVFRAGESHSYGILFRLPPGQPIQPHLAFVPLHPCQAFELRIRFPAGNVPARVWTFDGVPPRVLEVNKQIGNAVKPDQVGDVWLSFTSLRQGLAYGAGWRA